MLDSRSVIQYREGTELENRRIGDVSVHFANHTPGVERIKVPEHSVFLVGSDATTNDVWEGIRQAPIHRKAGMVLFLPAGTELTADPASNPYSETMVRMPDRALRSVSGGEIDYDSIEMRFDVVPEENVFGITAAFRNLALSDNPPLILVEALTDALAVAIICGLAPHATRALVNTTSTMSPSRLRRVQNFIEANLSKPITLGEIASHAALSQYHFVRAFRASVGVPPLRYVWYRRVEKAKRLMATTDIPLAEVSLSCGFSTQSHFTTTFKRNTGMTPAAWRATNRP